MTSGIQFNNYGVLIDELPNNLFLNLKSESLNLEKTNKPMISGISGQGAPGHYFLQDQHKKDLFLFVLHLVEQYNKIFPGYLEKFSIFTNNIPFKCEEPWWNVMKETDFIPNHIHGGFLSYSIWISCPFELPIDTNSRAGNFEFSYMSICGDLISNRFFVDKSFNGKIILFPSNMVHCVYPFYNSNKNRISLSGNIFFDTNNCT